MRKGSIRRTGLATIALISVSAAFLASRSEAAPACRITISPATATVPAPAGSGSLTVGTQDGCRWRATLSGGWLAVSSVSGTGTTVVTYRYSENTGAARTARFAINRVDFTLTQDAPSTPPPPPNEPPTADAGPDEMVTGGDAVTLQGSGSDPEGQALTFAWSQTGGPPVALSDPASATPTFTAPAATSEQQVLAFQLVANDGVQNSAADGTTVTIAAAPAQPPPPPEPTLLSDAASIAAAFKGSGNFKIAPGTYVGNFQVTGSDITVDATGVRFQPQDIYTAALTVLGSRITIAGLTVANGAPDRDTINVGANTITTIAGLPQDVTLQQVTAEAGPNGGHRGFGLHGINITLVDCTATGYWEQGRDSQAIWINNGPGPYTISGGYFEGSGENMLVGGALPGILDPSGIPSDITVRNAHFFKPLAWKTKTGAVKNLFELKSGKRVLVENCIFENNWKDAQAGSAILIKADNQGGTPWMETSDVVFRGNTVKNSPNGYVVNLRGYYPSNPSVRVRNVTFEHNLFEGVYGGIQSGEGVDGLTVVRNTFLTITTQFLNFYATAAADGTIFKTPLVFRDNVTHEGAYGVKGDGTASGAATLNKFTGPYDFTGNVIEITHSYTYPAGNDLVTGGTLGNTLDPVTHKYPGEKGY